MRPHSPHDVAEEGAPSSLSIPFGDGALGIGDSRGDEGAAVGWTFSCRVYKSSSGRSNTTDESAKVANEERDGTHCTKAFV